MTLLPLLAAALFCVRAGAVVPLGHAGEREHEHIMDEIAGKVAQLKAIRLAFPEAPDKEVLARRRLWLRAQIDALLSDEERARLAYAHSLQGLQVLFVTRGLDPASRHGSDPDQQAAVAANNLAIAAMEARRDALLREYDLDTAEFDALFARYRARRSLRRRAGAAVGLLFGAAALGALLRRRRRPPASPPAAPPAAPPPPPMPALIGGNLAVLGLVGRGGMGEVYEALDKTLNRRAALKRLRPELLSDPAELEGLLKEARLMAALKHPNLVAVYSVEKDAGQVYLAFEFVDGVTLQARLDQERRLPWPEALRIAQGVGAALDYAHGMKVVHRDLKPSNVMLSSKGEVKVMDFGIAHQAAKSVSRLTRAPAWGTPAYMAPEQELGGLSAAVDLYALSVCLYEMLTGELPFKGPNFLAQKRESLWTPPSRLIPGLPAGSDGLFAVALAPEPSRRFKTAADLLAACAALNS